ncbi:hypothetical protein KCU98_g10711, partial [Aureobasidium melanogenum]
MAALLHLPRSDAILTIALETSNIQAQFDARQQALKSRFDADSEALQQEIDHENQALRLQLEELGYRETRITGDMPADVRNDSSRTVGAVTIINVEPVAPTSDRSDTDTDTDADADASFSDVLRDALGRLSDFPEYARFCLCYPGLELTLCEACLERLPRLETLPAPCGDRYCTGCMTTLFEHATRDEAMYPPRCCGQTIPLDSVRSIITSELAVTFAKKAMEFDTTNRTYCSNSACNQFIPNDRINDDVAVCDACNHRTCSICKGNAHHDDCPEDETTQLALQLGDTQQWQRCNDCRSLVERSAGCNHITCRCRAQFCYICAAPWRTCSCPKFGEPDVQAGAANNPRRRIYQPTQAAVQASPNATPANPTQPTQPAVPAVPAISAQSTVPSTSARPAAPSVSTQLAVPTRPAVPDGPSTPPRRITLAQRARMFQRGFSDD